MKFPMKTGTILIGALLALPLAGHSQTATPEPGATASRNGSPSGPLDRLVTQYTDFAGSTANAQSLVKGLNSGSSITLTRAATATTSASSVSFTPPTGTMGVGNVNTALALAQASLGQQGITDPTPQQLQAALLGGSVKTSAGTADMPGILQLRAEGKGWGVIANSLGIRLGDVMRSSNAGANPAARDRAVSGSSARAERSQRAERIERPEKMERPDRMERPVRPERVERMGR